jgi:hypothetical protein
MDDGSQTEAANFAAELTGHARAAATLFEFEQIQLSISFFLFFGTLLLNVTRKNFSRYSFTHCTDIATIAPKLTSIIIWLLYFLCLDNL